MQDIIAVGGVAPTRAAARAGVVHMLSSVCAPGMEEVAKAADYPKFFQLYVRGDKPMGGRYAEEGTGLRLRAICLTVDRANYGRRERDMAKGA